MKVHSRILASISESIEIKFRFYEGMHFLPVMCPLKLPLINNN